LVQIKVGGNRSQHEAKDQQIKAIHRVPKRRTPQRPNRPGRDIFASGRCADIMRKPTQCSAQKATVLLVSIS
jgi:hypothetical protein